MQATPSAQRRILISILNWNTAGKTLDCVASLRRQSLPPGQQADILVIDNGSEAADYAQLVQGLDAQPVQLHREAANRGFAGGHNLAIRRAQEQGYDFIWLMNSDAVVAGNDVLAHLLEVADADPRCGAVSPLLADMEDRNKIHFYGAFHDWEQRISRRPRSVDDARRLAGQMPLNQWVPGTAVLLRLAALAQTGPLDERMFAYYEDDEIGARLAAHGWTSAVAYEASVQHAMPKRETDRPAYYFYLIARNYLIFWHGSTPPAHRKLLLLKLLDYALFDVNRLRHRGFEQHAEAALLGVQDFLQQRFGPPDLKRRASLALRCLRLLLWTQHRRVLRRMDSQA
ncbi:glycosyltransferase [Pseudoduganella violacea]|uniref:Glycosyltransferase 2-like domain-containing protein n=1 Tax=Pseudoduganella violacea TaxID=1715466 RepID=A0A7W5B5R6_9BURK|nr:glycosyltransferase family 2 protein [Pseudoduganella violacea]MBB3117076.1 hypothetical protein [Pseudoduganella violacea]